MHGLISRELKLTAEQHIPLITLSIYTFMFAARHLQLHAKPSSYSPQAHSANY